MSSAKWRPSKGGWGIFGSDPDSNYGKHRRGVPQKKQLENQMGTSINAMSDQLANMSTLTAGNIDRAEKKYELAESANKRAENAYGRAGEANQWAQDKADLQESNAGLQSSLASAQAGIQGRQAAKQAGMNANKMAASSGFAGMGDIQSSIQESMNTAYQQQAMSQANQGMQFRTSMFSAAEGRAAAARDYAAAGDTLGAANDALTQAGMDRDASIQQAQLDQSQAVAGMAKDITSMVTAFKDATGGDMYTSAALDALNEDIGG